MTKRRRKIIVHDFEGKVDGSAYETEKANQILFTYSFPLSQNGYLSVTHIQRHEKRSKSISVS